MYFIRRTVLRHVLFSLLGGQRGRFDQVRTEDLSVRSNRKLKCFVTQLNCSNMHRELRISCHENNLSKIKPPLNPSNIHNNNNVAKRSGGSEGRFLPVKIRSP